MLNSLDTKIAKIEMATTIAIRRICVSNGRYPFRRKSANELMRRWSSTWNWTSDAESSVASSIEKPSDPSGIDPAIQKEVLETCSELHSSIMELNEKVGTYIICQK